MNSYKVKKKKKKLARATEGAEKPGGVNWQVRPYYYDLKKSQLLGQVADKAKHLLP